MQTLRLACASPVDGPFPTSVVPGPCVAPLPVPAASAATQARGSTPRKDPYMRKKLAGALAAALAVGAAAVAGAAVPTGGGPGATPRPHTWENVLLDGRGARPPTIF